MICDCCGGDRNDCVLTPSGCVPKHDPDDPPVDCEPLDTSELTDEQQAALDELNAANATATVTVGLLDRVAHTMYHPALRRERSRYHG